MHATLVLNGDWVGEGVLPSPATWRLHVNGRRATLARFAESSAQESARYECTLAETPATFTFGQPCEEFIGIAFDMQLFVIAGLDDGNDVIFCRPGLAELFMRDAYASANLAVAPGRFALTRWAAA